MSEAQDKSGAADQSKAADQPAPSPAVKPRVVRDVWTAPAGEKMMEMRVPEFTKIKPPPKDKDD